MKIRLTLISCFCLVFSISFGVSADRIMEGLWLGPINTQLGAVQSIDVDYLEEYGGEAEISMVENGPAAGDEYELEETMTWEFREANMPDRFDVDLLWGGRTNHTAYFYIYIECDHDVGDVDLWLGSDDSIKVWVNGEVVHNNAVDRAIAVDADRVKIELVKGWNALMAKIGETGGGWLFSINLPDEPEEIIQLTTEKPDVQPVESAGKLSATWGAVKAK